MELKHVFHFYALADFSTIDRESSRFELWRTRNDRRVARKAKAFAWQENGHVHFAIAVLVMEQRDCIGPLRDASKADIARIARGDFGTEAFGVFTAIGEEFWVGGDANKDIAFHAA